MAMTWRVDGFAGNEQNNPARRLSNDEEGQTSLLSPAEHTYSDYYHASNSRPAVSAPEASKEDELELVDLGRDSAGLYQNSGYATTHTITANKRRYIILPDSTFRSIWANIQLVIALFVIWVTPVRVGFDMPAEGVWFWVEGVIDLFFWADMFLNFFTAYEHPVTGEIVTDHKKIAKRYLRTWFVIDLLATFPTDYVVRGVEGTWRCSFKGTCKNAVRTDSQVSLIVALRALRIFRIIWIFKNFNVLSISTILGRLQDELYIPRWFLSLMEVLLVLVFMGHLTGCFFYFFSSPRWWTEEERILIDAGDLSTWLIDKMGGYYTLTVPEPYSPPVPNPEPTDMVAYDAHTQQWYQCTGFFTIAECPKCDGPHLRCHSDFGFAYRYITSMYWAYTTMTTVGYGDISAVTIAEKLWSMVTMVIGGFFLSFCFGRMASILSRLDADKVARGEQMHQLTQFMKDMELPRALSRRVLQFSKKQQVRAYDKQAVLARLPFELRSNILRHLYLPTIQNVPLLQVMAEDDVFLTDFCQRLQPMHFAPESFVYQRGESGGDVFILLQGELHVLGVDGRTFLFRLPECTIFGECSVLRHIEGQTKIKRRDNIFCKTSSDMLKISMDDMIDLCEHYPELHRALFELDKGRQAHVRARETRGRPDNSESASLLGTAHEGSYSEPTLPDFGNGLSLKGTAAANGHVLLPTAGQAPPAEAVRKVLSLSRGRVQ